jgi:hypothetical protein
MKLTLTNDDGVLLEQWYLSEEEIHVRELKDLINRDFPVYLSKEDYIRLALDFGKTAEQHLLGGQP